MANTTGTVFGSTPEAASASCAAVSASRVVGGARLRSAGGSSAAGLSAPGTLYAAMTAQLRARNTLLPLLLFPLVVPALLGAVKATSLLILGDPMGQVGSWTMLLVAFDAPYPFPLSAARPMSDSWAIGLLLGDRECASPLARLTFSVADGTIAESTVAEPALEAARVHNPTARLLPLVAAIARRDGSTLQRIVLRQQNGGSLHVEVT